eukprot:Selendium_serpulae@DN3721_c0_g1_i2.p1
MVLTNDTFDEGTEDIENARKGKKRSRAAMTDSDDNKTEGLRRSSPATRTPTTQSSPVSASPKPQARRRLQRQASSDDDAQPGNPSPSRAPGAHTGTPEALSATEGEDAAEKKKKKKKKKSTLR